MSEHSIKNKRILCTGGAGSIGSELVRQLTPENDLYVFDSNETGMFDLVEELGIKGRVGDIRDKSSLYEAFHEFKPDLVFHSAALKHVTPNEFYPEEAIKTNILGTLNVVNAAKKYNAKLVNISTDKVCNAESIMGITKKIAERIVRMNGFVSVRFGNVMHSRGSLLEIWERQFKKNEPLTITDSRMKRYFMSIPEAVQLILKAAQEGKEGEIYILDMGIQKNILEMKEDMYGVDYPIKIIGIRPGETLEEKLFTEGEQKRVIKKGEFYVIN